MHRDSAVFDLQRLEQRTFFSVSPANPLVIEKLSPTAITPLAAPTDVLTKGVRQELLKNWNGPNKTALQKKLNTNRMGGFDSLLLSYMRSRAGNTFFWNTADVGSIKNFINANLATATTLANADHIVAHQFPDGNSVDYDVHLPAGDINWKTTNANPEFVYTLNRQDFWGDLAQAYVLTANPKYVNEMASQLASWSKQNPALADPNKGSGAGWQPLSVGIRADSWTWSYQMVLGSAGWTASANTLFLYKLYQHGDFLRRVKPYALNSNRALFEAQGLLQIAHLVPEFSKSADWKQYSRKLLFSAMDAQLNPDGGHAESSPGYAGSVISSLLEMYWLDRKKGEKSAWTKPRVTKLQNAAKTHVQLLSPDGRLPALSDTYRSTIGPFWDRPRIILSNTTDFPAAKPRLRDVWLFGTATTGTLLGAPVSPALPNRGNTYSMPQSGYHVMRSGWDFDARQITFDAGPTGGEAHGHLDLLNFELFGYGKPLISDPGVYAYNTSARRKWAISTPAHNTISVDGKSHAAIDAVKNGNIWSSGIIKTSGGYQITASHRGYTSLSGAPTVTRSIWYDGNDTMLIADLGQSTSTKHTYAQSFLLPTTNTSRDLAAGWMQTKNPDGNVKIQSLLQPGQAAHRQTQIPGTRNNVFVSNDPDGNIANSATRFYIDQKSTTVRFVTLISAFNGSAAPNVTAKVIGKSTTASALTVQIYRNGAAAERVSFSLQSGSTVKKTSPLSRQVFVHPGTSNVIWQQTKDPLRPTQGVLDAYRGDKTPVDLFIVGVSTSRHLTFPAILDAKRAASAAKACPVNPQSECRMPATWARNRLH